jgi:hypothetical protein
MYVNSEKRGERREILFLLILLVLRWLLVLFCYVFLGGALALSGALVCGSLRGGATSARTQVENQCGKYEYGELAFTHRY